MDERLASGVRMVDRLTSHDHIEHGKNRTRSTGPPQGRAAPPSGRYKGHLSDRRSCLICKAGWRRALVEARTLKRATFDNNPALVVPSPAREASRRWRSASMKKCRTCSSRGRIRCTSSTRLCSNSSTVLAEWSINLITCPTIRLLILDLYPSRNQDRRNYHQGADQMVALKCLPQERNRQNHSEKGGKVHIQSRAGGTYQLDRTIE